MMQIGVSTACLYPETTEQALDDLLDSTGLDAENFESYVGMTVEEYAKQYNMGVNVLLTKELDTIYDRLEKK